MIGRRNLSRLIYDHAHAHAKKKSRARVRVLVNSCLSTTTRNWLLRRTARLRLGFSLLGFSWEPVAILKYNNLYINRYNRGQAFPRTPFIKQLPLISTIEKILYLVYNI